MTHFLVDLFYPARRSRICGDLQLAPKCQEVEKGWLREHFVQAQLTPAISKQAVRLIKSSEVCCCSPLLKALGLGDWEKNPSFKKNRCQLNFLQSEVELEVLSFSSQLAQLAWPLPKFCFFVCFEQHKWVARHLSSWYILKFCNQNNLNGLRALQIREYSECFIFGWTVLLIRTEIPEPQSQTALALLC